MRPCMYDAYEKTFLRARGALLAGDLETLRDVARGDDGAAVSRAMAVLLATSDARRGRAQRGKVHVCRILSAFCRCELHDAAAVPGRTG